MSKKRHPKPKKAFDHPFLKMPSNGQTITLAILSFKESIALRLVKIDQQAFTDAAMRKQNNFEKLGVFKNMTPKGEKSLGE